MTGESKPARKAPGDFLMSGTRNLSARLIVIVTKEQKDSALERLISGIASATEQKFSGQEGVDVMAGSFVKIVLTLTLIGSCWTYLSTDVEMSGLDRLNAVCQRAMAMLAAACPCALGLANASAGMAALGNISTSFKVCVANEMLDAAWNRGVLIMGGSRAVEALSRLTHIIMDKTGTLTEGRLSVSKYDSIHGSESEHELQCILLCAAEREAAQFHPVGRAVFSWSFNELSDSQKRLPNETEVRYSSEDVSTGIMCEAKLPGNTKWWKVHVGSQPYLQSFNIPLNDTLKSDTIRGSTTVFLTIDDKHVGTLHLQDKIRNEAPTVIKTLRKRGLNLTMLTGDIASEADRVSHQLSIPVLSACALPEQKRDVASQLRSKGHVVAMVGDGMNDRAAQAEADVGILLSPSRSFTPIGADVVIMSPDLGTLPELIEMAEKVMRFSKWSVRWVVLYNFVALGLAMGLLERWGVAVNPATAGMMMAFSSVGILCSGLLLRRQLLVEK